MSIIEIDKINIEESPFYAPEKINNNFDKVVRILTDSDKLLSISKKNITLVGKVEVGVGEIESNKMVLVAKNGKVISVSPDGNGEVAYLDHMGILSVKKILIDNVASEASDIKYLTSQTIEVKNLVITESVDFGNTTIGSVPKILPVTANNIGNNAQIKLDIKDSSVLLLDASNNNTQLSSGNVSLVNVLMANLADNQEVKIQLFKKNVQNIIGLFNEVDNPRFVEIDPVDGFKDVTENLLFDIANSKDSYVVMQLMDFSGTKKFLIKEYKNIIKS